MRARAVAVAQLAAFLEAGLPIDESLRRVAAGMPPGDSRSRLEGAAQTVAGGAPVEAALARVFPELGGGSRRDGSGLPQRLALVGAFLLRADRLRRRLSTIAWYPTGVASALLLLALASSYATSRLAAENGLLGPDATLITVLFVLGAVALCLDALVSARRRRPPAWARHLPGGDAWRLTTLAELMARYALARDSRLAHRSPPDALNEATRPLPRLRPVRVDSAPTLASALARAGVPPDEAAALLQGERADRAVEAADREAERLDAAAGAAAERFARSTHTALLVAVAIALAVFVMAVYRHGALAMIASLGSGG